MEQARRRAGTKRAARQMQAAAAAPLLCASVLRPPPDVIMQGCEVYRICSSRHCCIEGSAGACASHLARLPLILASSPGLCFGPLPPPLLRLDLLPTPSGLLLLLKAQLTLLPCSLPL